MKVHSEAREILVESVSCGTHVDKSVHAEALCLIFFWGDAEFSERLKTVCRLAFESRELEVVRLWNQYSFSSFLQKN